MGSKRNRFSITMKFFSIFTVFDTILKKFDNRINKVHIKMSSNK